MQSVVNDFKEVEYAIRDLKAHGSDLQIFLAARQLNQKMFQKIQSFKKDAKTVPDSNIKFKINPVIRKFLSQVQSIGKVEII